MLIHHERAKFYGASADYGYLGRMEEISLRVSEA